MDKIPLSQRLGRASAKDLVTRFSRIYTDEFCEALEEYCGGSGYSSAYKVQIVPAVIFYPDTRLAEAVELILDRAPDAWAPLLYLILIDPYVNCYFEEVNDEQL